MKAQHYCPVEWVGQDQEMFYILLQALLNPCPTHDHTPSEAAHQGNAQSQMQNQSYTSKHKLVEKEIRSVFTRGRG